METAQPRGHWARIRERGSMWGLRFTVRCYRTFGPVLSLPLIYAVVGYFFLTDARGRAASQRYLERVREHGERNGERVALPSRAGTWQSFLHYREFALSIADRVGLWSGASRDFAFDFSGRDHFDRLHEEGRGAILYGAHLGSFDALRVLSVLDGVAVNVLMYTQHAPMINEIFRELAPEAEVRVIAAADDSARTALRIKACLDRGEHVAILADRVEARDRKRVVPLDFLGLPAVFPEAPFQLPSLLGAPALLVLALRSGPRSYAVRVELLGDEREPVPRGERPKRSRALVEAYVRRLEHYCVRWPRQWFNFYDVWDIASEAS